MTLQQTLVWKGHIRMTSLEFPSYFAVDGSEKLSIDVPGLADRVKPSGEHCLILMLADV